MRIKDLKFERSNPFEDDILYAASIFLPTNYGIKRTRVTVLNRMTGFGHRDIETGYREVDGRFWLASGYFDIRDFGDLTEHQAIEKIKANSNNCNGTLSHLVFRKAYDIKTRAEVTS